jgi:hypothetical protein
LACPGGGKYRAAGQKIETPNALLLQPVVQDLAHRLDILPVNPEVHTQVSWPSRP